MSKLTQVKIEFLILSTFLGGAVYGIFQNIVKNFQVDSSSVTEQVSALIVFALSIFFLASFAILFQSLSGKLSSDGTTVFLSKQSLVWKIIEGLEGEEVTRITLCRSYITLVVTLFAGAILLAFITILISTCIGFINQGWPAIHHSNPISIITMELLLFAVAGLVSKMLNLPKFINAVLGTVMIVVCAYTCIEIWTLIRDADPQDRTRVSVFAYIYIVAGIFALIAVSRIAYALSFFRESLIPWFKGKLCTQIIKGNI